MENFLTGVYELRWIIVFCTVAVLIGIALDLGRR